MGKGGEPCAASGDVWCLFALVQHFFIFIYSFYYFLGPPAAWLYLLVFWGTEPKLSQIHNMDGRCRGGGEGRGVVGEENPEAAGAKTGRPAVGPVGRVYPGWGLAGDWLQTGCRLEQAARTSHLAAGTWQAEQSKQKPKHGEPSREQTPTLQTG